MKYNTELYKIQYTIKRLGHLHQNMSIKVKMLRRGYNPHQVKKSDCLKLYLELCSLKILKI